MSNVRLHNAFASSKSQQRSCAPIGPVSGASQIHKNAHLSSLVLCRHQVDQESVPSRPRNHGKHPHRAPNSGNSVRCSTTVSCCVVSMCLALSVMYKVHGTVQGLRQASQRTQPSFQETLDRIHSLAQQFSGSRKVIETSSLAFINVRSPMDLSFVFIADLNSKPEAENHDVHVDKLLITWVRIEVPRCMPQP